MNIQNHKNLLFKSRLFRFIGFLVITISTLGAFFIYETAIEWENFKQETGLFVVVKEDTLKLNLAIALPILASFLVFLVVVMRRNKEFVTEKPSASLIVLLLILYLVYSVIEVVMFSLVGSVIGSILDDFIFKPLSKHYKRKSTAQKDIDVEYDKEKLRIKARRQAQEDILNGSV